MSNFMNQVSKSLASLVKSNNGEFKSQSQADFLLSQRNSGDSILVSGEVRGNSFTLSYVLDSTGVVEVIKNTKVKGDVVTFTRKIEGILTPQEIKKIKTLKGKIKRLEKHIKERDDQFNNGGYSGKETLYETSKADDEETLNYYIEELSELESQA